jgi:DNA uptake protein ComE-like DNA-binding protein
MLHQSNMRFAVLTLVMALCIWPIGCSACGAKQNPEQLKERTAQTTAELKSDAKAVASGIREGWSRDKPLDINHASKEQLVSLPGISAGEAERIVANRPYEGTQDLITKHVITQREFDQIRDRIVVK